MARYKVKAGHILPHNGVVLEEGAELELPPHVADDIEIRHRIEPVSAKVPIAVPVAVPVADVKAAPPIDPA
jgi:hypothetical protein